MLRMIWSGSSSQQSGIEPNPYIIIKHGRPTVTRIFSSSFCLWTIVGRSDCIMFWFGRFRKAIVRNGLIKLHPFIVLVFLPDYCGRKLVCWVWRSGGCWCLLFVVVVVGGDLKGDSFVLPTARPLPFWMTIATSNHIVGTVKGKDGLIVQRTTIGGQALDQARHGKYVSFVWRLCGVMRVGNQKKEGLKGMAQTITTAGFPLSLSLSYENNSLPFAVVVDVVLLVVWFFLSTTTIIIPWVAFLVEAGCCSQCLK